MVIWLPRGSHADQTRLFLSPPQSVLLRGYYYYPIHYIL